MLIIDKVNLKYEYWKRIISLRKKGIYLPLYNGADMYSQSPVIYNSYGKKMDVFFYRDIHNANVPYIFKSDKFIFDRYNYGLPIHFYSNKEMFTPVGQPNMKFGMVLESRAICPKEYAFIDRNIDRLDEYKRILTYDDFLLNKLSNVAFVPFAATIWYRKGKLTEYDASNYLRKEKNCSIISSGKKMTKMHKIRIALAEKMRTNSNVDTYGSFDNQSRIDNIDVVFEKYRFSIVIENATTDYYFTEKILNCFAAQTIPIYIGARKISEFFDSEGIIQIDLKELDEIEDVLKKCTEEEYEGRIEHVQENYRRVLGYVNNGDNIYNAVLNDIKV